MSGGGGEYSDQKRLLNSANSTNYDEENELEAQDGRSSSLNRSTSSSRGSGGGGGGFRDLLKHLDRGFSGRRHSFKRPEIRDNSRNTIVDNHHQLNHLNASDANDVLGDSAPPEWAMLLLGCLLGLATGLFVAAFNKGVCSFLFWIWSSMFISFLLCYHLSHVQSLSTCLSLNATDFTLFAINAFILH